MLPNMAAPFCDARICLTCAQKSSWVVLEKFNAVMKSGTSLGCHSKTNFKSAQNCSTLSVNHLPYDSISKHVSKDRISWYFNYMCRYPRTLPKRSIINYQNKQLFKVNRNALFNYQYAPHHRNSDTEIQCRTYTTKSVNETLTDWTEQLMTAGVPEARLSVEHIIAHILDVSRKELSILGESQLSEGVLAEAERLMTCRLARMPVQYIIGNWDFHSVTIKVRPPVFIPRPETEQLVDLALESLQGIKAPRVLDICCGSGAISLALLKNISDLRCVALDHSKHAIELTEENANLLGIRERLTLLHEKVTLERAPNIPYNEFDLIISNPPYVLRKDVMNVQPEIMIYEDMRALDGGKEGLDIVKPILLHFQHFLSVGRYLLLEVDPCHQYLVPTWIEEQQQQMKIKLLDVLKDFNGKDRFLKFVRIP